MLHAACLLPPPVHSRRGGVNGVRMLQHFRRVALLAGSADSAHVSIVGGVGPCNGAPPTLKKGVQFTFTGWHLAADEHQADVPGMDKNYGPSYNGVSVAGPLAAGV